MRLTLRNITKLKPNVWTFCFESDKMLRRTAGQFTELHLPHDNPDNRGTKRWFTISSSPTEKFVCITTKFAPKSSTFKKRLRQLKPSDTVDAAEPMGDFVLPKDSSIPLVFVAGGIGVTPFRSIIKFLIDSGEKRQLQVILAANLAGDVLFDDLCRQYRLEPIIVLTEPPKGWTGETGHLDAAKILRLIGEVGHKQIYISGPEPMVESLNKQLIDHGVPSAQLVGDYFPGYQPI